MAVPNPFVIYSHVRICRKSGCSAIQQLVVIHKHDLESAGALQKGVNVVAKLQFHDRLVALAKEEAKLEELWEACLCAEKRPQ